MNTRRNVTLIYIAAAIILACVLIFLPSSQSIAARQIAVDRAIESAKAMRAMSIAASPAASALRQTLRAAAHAGAALGRRTLKDDTAAAGSTFVPVQITERVQTFDEFAPGPTYVPVPGVSMDGDNQQPCWSPDESYILFASDMGGDGTHIWEVPSVGGAPIEITTGEGMIDQFPVITPTGDGFAFTSGPTANSQSLYVVTGAAYAAALAGTTPIAVSSLTPITTPALSATQGFSTVGRPAWSTDETLLAFAGFTDIPSTAGPEKYKGNGHWHIYWLYLATGGYSQNPGVTPNPPGKLTDGEEDDEDPAWSPDGNFIAFSSNASGWTDTNEILPNPAHPSEEIVPSVATGFRPVTDRSISVIAGSSGEVPPSNPNAPIGPSNPPITSITTQASGQTDGQPCWSALSFTVPGEQQTFQPILIGFSRRTSPAAAAQIYYYRAEVPGTDTPILEADTVAGVATQLNTSEPAKPVDDTYPAFSPWISIFSMVYSSPRSVSYSDENGNPTETAYNVLPNAPSSIPFTVGAKYHGILQSEVAQLTPPSLIPENKGNTIVAVTNALDPSAPAAQIFAPGTPLTFTVRLSSREAGVDPSHVFIQIKDPENYDEDINHMEHKLLATDNVAEPSSIAPNDQDYQWVNDFEYIPFGATSTPVIGTNSQLYLGLVDEDLNNGPNPLDEYSRGAIGEAPSVGNNWCVGQTVNPSTGAPALLDGPTILDYGLLQPEFVDYRSWGPEYECQYVNAQYSTANGLQRTDFGRPFYLAGFDDQTPGSAPRAAYTTGQSNSTRSVRPEWLQLSVAPQQDNKGGILFQNKTAWTAPGNWPSDYIIDVIAYDNQHSNGTSNWRIYDNVWGFTTHSVNDINKDQILVVSDYASGQKWPASTYGGNANQHPTFFGAESYLTGIDPKYLPNALNLWGSPPSGAKLPKGVTDVHTLNPLQVPVINTLGDWSYGDPATDNLAIDGWGYFDTVVNPNNLTTAPTQQYAIWRTLCRGPITQSILTDFGPDAPVQEPPVDDSSSGALINEAGATVPSAPKCVIWLSPYAGQFAPLQESSSAPYSITNANTLTALDAFIKSGGRLFITGPTIASALSTTEAGTAFLNNDLNASYTGQPVPNSFPTSNDETDPAATGRISAEGIISGTNHAAHQAIGPDSIGSGSNYFEWTTNGLLYSPPSKWTNVFLSDDKDWIIGESANERTDASLDEFNTVSLGFGNNIVALEPDAVTAFAKPVAPTPPASNDYSAANGTTPEMLYTAVTQPNNEQSRVVFAPFGFESIGTEYYDWTVGSSTLYAAYNLRPLIMHNIVNYLRTGTLAGTVTPPGNGIVYAVPWNGGQPIGLPTGRTVYSALLKNGSWTMEGVEPGVYDLYAYGPAYLPAGQPNSTVQVAGGAEVNFGPTNLQLTAGPTVTVEGTVFDGSNNPLGNCTVTYTSQDGTNTTGSAVTGPTGTYQISLPVAESGTEYVGQAVLNGSNGASASATLTLTLSPSSGIVTGKNFTIVVSNGGISGTIRDSKGNIIPAAADVTVNATPSSGGSPTAGTYDAATGGFQILNLPNGTYTVSASADGYFGNSVDGISVTKGIVTVIKTPLVLTSTAGKAVTIGGVVTGSVGNILAAGIPISISGTQSGATTSAATTTSPASPAGDSKPQNYSFTVATGSYKISLPGLSIPTATYGTPGKFYRVNLTTTDAGGLGGLMTTGPSNGSPEDVHAVVDVANSSGVVIAQIPMLSAAKDAPASPVGDGLPVDYELDLAPGNYTLTPTDPTNTNLVPTSTAQVTVVAGKFKRANLSFQANHTFPAGLLEFSTPYDYSSEGRTWDDLFGTNRSKVEIWSPTISNYVTEPTSPADSDHLGLGYWINLGHSVDFQAGPLPTGNYVKVQLNPGWNMIGVPSLTPVPINNVEFLETSGPDLSWTAATTSPPYVVGSILYTYDPNQANGYDGVASSLSVSPNVNGTNLMPWAGYWIYAYMPATIMLPTHGLPATPTGLTAAVTSGTVTLNWNTAAAATTYNVFRGTSAGGEATTPYASGLTTPTFTDNTVQPGTNYYYTVDAINSLGTSAMSNEVEAVIPAATQ